MGETDASVHVVTSELLEQLSHSNTSIAVAQYEATQYKIAQRSSISEAKGRGRVTGLSKQKAPLREEQRPETRGRKK